ncbi:MAG: hypothetical protein IPK17_37415, partial [Chloroflexi bacterium]|uniref:hypothetical protein n=1 Tax=Candidatus Flexifilum breve TaxID=3140694 RepID=UPI003135BD31|nr:hypothetical protein [Chloroflexota bacterium]
ATARVRPYQRVGFSEQTPLAEWLTAGEPDLSATDLRKPIDPGSIAAASRRLERNRRPSLRSIRQAGW